MVLGSHELGNIDLPGTAEGCSDECDHGSDLAAGRYADRSDTADILSDDHRVDSVIQLLQEIGQQQRDDKCH